MAHHNTIRNIATHIRLYTPKHTGKHTHSSYTISLPSLLTTPPNRLQWCWQDDRTPQHPMKINTQPNDNTAYQRAHFHVDYFGISVYVFNGSLFECNNIFLQWYILLSVNSQLINGFVSNGLAQSYNLDTLLILSPVGFIFCNHVPISCTSIFAIQEPYFPPYMIFECQYNIQS